MNNLPPLLPDETYDRVVRVANVDGLSVLAIAGMFALAAASVRDVQGTVVGLLVAAAGAVELHGLGLLRSGDGRGMRWLIASQPYLMIVLLGYCAWRLAVPEIPPLPQELMPVFRRGAEQFGQSVQDYVATLHKITYAVVAAVTVLYQGGMTLYYVRRRRAVVAAVEGGEERE